MLMSSQSFWLGLSKQNKSKKQVYDAISRVMYEFGLSAWDVYGGEGRITGFVGDSKVDLKLSYDGMDSLVFSDLVGFLKSKDEAEKKASKKRK